MRIITVDFLVKTIARTWKEHYFVNGNWTYGGVDKQTVYEELLALNPPTKQAIDNIIGNGSWTRIKCDCCDQEVQSAVVIDVTHGEYTTYLCADCLKDALGSIHRKEQP